MKLLAITLSGSLLLLAACQSQPHKNDFAQKTHRTYNAETGSFEQTPPYGKQSNKSDESQ